MAFPNKFAGTCPNCGGAVAAGAGLCEKGPTGWIVRCAQPCVARAHAVPNKPKPIQAAVAVVGDLTGILALFDRAKKHLKFPAIVLSAGKDLFVRISVATDAAKVPGSLTVLDADRGETGRRDWFGRILVDGTFQPSRLGAAHMPELAQRLAQFAADPAKVAGEDGRLHGRCCFCNRALDDERSTAVGYGPTCAKNFELAWGERPAAFGRAA